MLRKSSENIKNTPGKQTDWGQMLTLRKICFQKIELPGPRNSRSPRKFIACDYFVKSFGGVFFSRSTVMDAEQVQRALTRVAHEIIERNRGLDDLVIVALQTGGFEIAQRIAQLLFEIEGEDVPVGSLDVALYRDDIGLRPVMPEAVTDIPFDLAGLTVILVDDVLFTGRTIRAALDALTDFGRPKSVQLAVVIDRGHRELPIRPDYVGKNLPTRRDEAVDVHLDGVLLGEMRK